MKKDEQKTGLWAILKPVQSYINRGLIFAGVGAVFLILSLTLLSFVLAALVDKKPVVLMGFEMDLMSTIVVIGILSLCASLSRLYGFKASHLGAFKLEVILRDKMSEHLARLPLGFIITNGSGALKKVFLDDVKGLHAFVADSTPMVAKSAVGSALSMGILLFIDYRFALVSLGVLLFGGILMSIAMRDSVELRKKYEQGQTDINKAIVEFVQAMPVVRTFDDGATSFKRYHDALVSFRKNLIAWIKKTGVSARFSLITLSPLPTLLAILCAGVCFLHNGTLELSSFIAALFLSTGMADGVMPLMFLFNHIKKSQASAKRIQEIFAQEELPLTNNPQIPKDPSIVFENVSFAYNEKEVLTSLSFTTPPKSITALVGTSGAGKSTVAKLIPRFWDIKSGSIKIGGVDIRQMSYEVLMQNISFVFQDTFLFSDTILNNIRMANPQKCLDDVKAAAKAAQIDDFIENLEKGYETKVSDRGVSLSGGQRQRITIARAILRDTPIIILDEATAFADPENEEEIVKAMSYLIKNKTVIIIAHRLSTIKDSDQIVVLDDGKVSEMGVHEQLVKNRGVYAKLWEKYEIAQNWEAGVENAS